MSPSREEVARAVAEHLHGVGAPAWLVANTADLLDDLSRTVVDGHRIRIEIGRDHDGCETCGGRGLVPNGLPSNGPDPCPDGSPVYWEAPDE